MRRTGLADAGRIVIENAPERRWKMSPEGDHEDMDPIDHGIPRENREKGRGAWRGRRMGRFGKPQGDGVGTNPKTPRRRTATCFVEPGEHGTPWRCHPCQDGNQSRRKPVVSLRSTDRLQAVMPLASRSPSSRRVGFRFPCAQRTSRNDTVRPQGEDFFRSYFPAFLMQSVFVRNPIRIPWRRAPESGVASHFVSACRNFPIPCRAN